MSIRIPTQEQIEELWERCKVSDRLARHLLAVTKIAVFLAEKLKEKGIPVNVEAVRAGAMLHDIDKILTLGKGGHGEVGKKILEDKGFPEIGKIAFFHSVDKSRIDDLTWEERLVRYADGRCQEGDIVSLRERFEYVNTKYPPKDPEARKIGMEDNLAFEKEVSEMIGIDVADIHGWLE